MSGTNQFNSRWTKELLDRLRQYLVDGLTFGKIADELGEGFTRSSIAGAVRRHGMQGLIIRPPLPTPASAPALVKRKLLIRSITELPTSASTSRSAVRPMPSEVKLPKDYCGGTLAGAVLRLRSDQCRWMIGNDRFCQHSRHASLSYCSKHAEIAYSVLPRGVVL